MLELMYPNDICTVVEQLDNDLEIEGQKPDATWRQEILAEEKILEIIYPNGNRTVVEQLV